MKKILLVTSLSLTSLAALGLNSTYAASTTLPTLPPGWESLSTTDLSTLSTLTGAARDTFLESKGITRPEGTQSGTTIKNLGQHVSSIAHTRSTVKTTENETTVSTTTRLSREERLAQNQAKTLEAKKQKLQSKIANNEQLTRIEKNFAKKYGIEYSETISQ